MDKSRQKYLIRLLDSYCEPMKKTLQGFIFVITLCTIFQVYAIASLITAVVTDFQNYGEYWIYFVIIVITYLVKAGAIYLKTRHTQRVAGKIRQQIRQQIVARCKTLGEKGLGYNTTTMSIFYIEQVDLLNNYIARFYPQSFASRIQPMLILIAVFISNWVAGLVLLLTSPLLPIFMILIGYKTSEMNARQLKSLLYLGNQFHDKMAGIKTIISFSQQEKVLQKMTQSSMDYTRTTVDLLKIAFLNSAVLEFLSAICIALMALYFGLTYLENTSWGTYTGVGVSLVSGFFCLTLAGEFFMPLKDLGAFYHDRSSALNAIDELDKFINQQAVENLEFIDVDKDSQGEFRLAKNLEFNSTSSEDVASAKAQLEDRITGNKNNFKSLFGDKDNAPSPEQASQDPSAKVQAENEIEDLEQQTDLEDLNVNSAKSGEASNDASNNASSEAQASPTDSKAPDSKTQNSKAKKSRRSGRRKLPPIFLDAATAPRIQELNYPFSEFKQASDTQGSENSKFVKFDQNTLVELQDLTVYTHSGKALVSNLNLSFKLGDKIAIIGLSGVGKTTLLSALLGLYPYTGAIKFDGVELTKLNPQQFYAYFSWLGQNPNLDQVSILENLEFKGNYLANSLDNPPRAIEGLEASQAQFQAYLQTPGLLSNYSIKQVVDLAKIDDLVAEKGFDYTIQQHNIGLSGGQVQRIALARALAKPHLFLIIDEPTANLDAKLEQAVFTNIANHQQGVLMVTHRLKHTQAFDRIYKLDAQGLHLVEHQSLDTNPNQSTQEEF